MSKKDGGPAFPTVEEQFDGVGGRWGFDTAPGMTLRDYFAGQALAGILSGRYWEVVKIEDPTLEAYKIADGMLSVREEELKGE